MKYYSLWQKEREAFIPDFPELRGKINTDVLIIGGGMAGILTAKMLSDKGVDCVIAESNRICSGTTANTTAKITVGHGLIYSKIAEKYGKEKAKMYLDANTSALKEYRKLSETIPCDFSDCNSYIYTRRNPKAIEKEVALLREIGGDAEYSNNLPLPFDTICGVNYPNQAQFHPLKFVGGIINQAGNLRIYEHSQIIDIEGKTAFSPGGQITAEKIIIATHFPFINRRGMYFLKMHQSRSYVATLKNAPALDGMYMDENPQGYSFRNCGELLLLGGGSHKTGEPCKRDDFYQTAKELYPHAKITALWGAQDCMTLDSIPYIGHYSKNTPDMYVATGFNKWGMTSSMASAIILSDMITGKKNENTPVFNPSRNMFGKELMKNAGTATKNLLTPTSPRCPHMGCALKWNSPEHSWDCPCHGSRFDEKGNLLNNPANKPLE